MNKKLFKKALMAVVAIVIAIGISIGSAVWVHNRGGVPTSSKSAVTAYDLAVQNGYNGDLETWLMSLVGETGAAGRNGKVRMN